MGNQHPSIFVVANERVNTMNEAVNPIESNQKGFFVEHLPSAMAWGVGGVALDQGVRTYNYHKAMKDTPKDLRKLATYPLKNKKAWTHSAKWGVGGIAFDLGLSALLNSKE